MISTYKYCVVPLCKNTTVTEPDKIYFLIPKGADTRKKWCNAMGREGHLSSNTSLYCCQDHFNIEDDTKNYMEYKIMGLQEGYKTSLRLKEGIIPHTFLCQQQTSDSGALKRKRKEFIDDAGSGFQSESKEKVEFCNVADNSKIDVYEAGPNKLASQKEAEDVKTSEKVNQAIQVKVKCRSRGVNVKSFKSENVAGSLSPVLQQNETSPPSSSSKNYSQDCESFTCSSQPSVSSQPLSSDFELHTTSSESSLVLEDDTSEENLKKIMQSSTLMIIEKEPKLLIGLPKKSYYVIKLLSEATSLATIDILMTLRKIKLNESFSILALHFGHFGYTQSTVSRIFAKSVTLIAQQMKDLIVWPTTEQIFKNLPISFTAQFANLVSIIEFLEIKIEIPTNSTHRSLIWSEYEKCNTLKYLISCSPDGLVSFVSEGYGGTETDVTIVQKCGYLECLPANTAVMADRGLKDLTSLLERKQCTLVQAPWVSESTPSIKEEVNVSNPIDPLRIHVESVVNRLREFQILLPHTCIDQNVITVIDEVVLIACAMINLQDV